MKQFAPPDETITSALSRIVLFEDLSPEQLTALARIVRRQRFPRDSVIVAQGDVGDRYYVIESGQADVVGDGRVVAQLGAGDGFGEIALLRRTPRTAGVVAHTDLILRALEPETFGAAIMGYAPSARAAQDGVDGQLGRFSPPGVPAQTPPDSTA